MKREYLRDMGLTDEQINNIMSAHHKEINGLNVKLNDLTAEKDLAKIIEMANQNNP